jgi:prepilin-type N-terminal cleavage/methylation domain-containing protein
MHVIARPAQRRHGFTLIELLVVIGILAVLGILTVISAQRLSRSSRVSSAVNTVTNALQLARAQAIRQSTTTAVVFRPIWDPNNKQKPQQTEVVIAETTHELHEFNPGQQLYGIPNLAERFIPVNGAKTIRLPAGIKVAGPGFEGTSLDDARWYTQCELKAAADCSEAMMYSATIAVMFNPDGSLVTLRNAASGSDSKAFLDFLIGDADGDGDPQDTEVGTCPTTGYAGIFSQWWITNDVNDETNFVVVPFLAVYDDRAARDVKATDWADPSNLYLELVGPGGFISTNAQQINFNRYTGIAEVQQ